MSVEFCAYAPASSANLSVGFDLLGIAVSPVDGSPLGDFVSSSELDPAVRGNASENLSILCEGRYASKLPADPRQNILFDAYDMYVAKIAEKGLAPKRLSLRLNKGLPVCSGLGSSASSVVAAVLAINASHDFALPESELLSLMGALEGKISGTVHFDNIAPCYHGGMRLISDEPNNPNVPVSVPVPFFDSWYWVLCFPGIKVSTAAARSILPAQYLRRDVITFGRRLAAFIHASYTHDEDLAKACLVDVIAEPYRASLIDGFEDAKAFALARGALASGISGSGSTVFSVFSDPDAALMMKEYLERSFIANEDGFCRICKVSKEGARVREGSF